MSAKSSEQRVLNLDGLPTWQSIVFLSFLCFSVGLLYAESSRWLYGEWSGGKTYSHGFLVPVISLYLLWVQRQRFMRLPVLPAALSASVIIFSSLLLLLVSRGSAVIQIEAFSLFVIIPGVILFIWGWQVLRAALLPWLYLLFMFPVWGFVLDHIEYPSQRFSAFLGAKLLSLIYPVYRDDVYIHLPSINMVVAGECSGISFLIAVIAVGIPLVYLTQRTWGRAIIVLLAGCLLTLLSNGLRVALAGVMGQCFGPEMLHGPNHIFQGWFVAWFGWIGLFLVNWLVARYSDKSLPVLSERWEKAVVPDGKIAESQKVRRGRLWGMAVFFVFCAMVVRFVEPQPTGFPTEISSLPLKLGNWQGREEKWFGSEAFFPNMGSSIERVYRSTDGAGPVYLFIGYYAKQTEKSRLISQYSRPLHKGVVRSSFQSASDGKRLVVNQGKIAFRGMTYPMLFWYQFPGYETITGRNQARLAALKNAVIHRRNNGAVVIMATPHNGTERNEGNFTAVMQDFSQEILPLLGPLLQ